MTSSQQPPQSSWDSQDPATYQRLGVPVPRLLRVRELQAYKDWVEDGGLDRIASAHGIKPDFIYHLSDHTPAVYLAYRRALRAVPGLATVMAPTPRDDMPSMSTATAQQMIQDAECGWSSEEEDEKEDDKEQEEVGEELQGSKEERVDAAALEQDEDALVDFVVAPIDDTRPYFSSPARNKTFWESPMKRRRGGSPDSSPMKRHRN
ncbi:hypothetical protein AA0114_g12235 [Alternaria tenuissima]|uniref:Uncharacterized protein n=1 Tax=Alternaria tenuissima TaxID=119927 RepID=A0A4Q4M0G0_9PLEO|nr:hypothetical protein AA0114_g12235 [Alternaria tenuissima]